MKRANEAKGTLGGLTGNKIGTEMDRKSERSFRK